MLDGQIVQGIANKNYKDGVFAQKGINFVFLPNTIKEIGDYSFYANHIHILNLNHADSLERFGNYALAANELLILDLQNCSQLTCVGEGALAFNNISKVYLNSCDHLDSIGERAFDNNELASFPFSSFPGLKYIGNGAFSSNQLDTVDLTSMPLLNHLGDYAFFYNILDSINIISCSQLTYIGEAAFYKYQYLGGGSGNFHLPNLAVSDSICEYWVNQDGEVFSADTIVPANRDGYRAHLMKGWNIHFYISDGTSPLAHVPVSLISYDIDHTDSLGAVSFVVPPNQIFKYQIIAPGYYPANGSLELANDTLINLVLQPIPGANQNAVSGAFNIFPNPSAEVVNISLQKPATIQLYSLAGKLIYAQQHTDNLVTIPMSDCDPGYYIIRINVDDRSYHREIVKL